MTKILVLGTADWDQPIATNQHYMVRELAKEFPILFTESMGLRTPEFRMRDLRRIAKRAGLGVTSTPAQNLRNVPAQVDIRSPKVLPRHTGMAWSFNKPRVQKLVDDWASQGGPRLLWTYSPVTYGLEELASEIVYHCVDLLGEVDGIPSDLIYDSEMNLARHGAHAIGSSPVVVGHLEKMGFIGVRNWSNVADTTVISGARPELVERDRRRAVFAGNLTSNKVDFTLLRQVIDAGIDLHIAGPVAEGGGDDRRNVDRLVEAGAVYHGMLNLDQLAELYWTASIGLIPYRINDYTRGVNPLKTYEYLAAGLAVVSTSVPAVKPIDGHVTVTPDSDTFVRAATKFTEAPISNASASERSTLAGSHSWSGRGVLARDLARELLRS